MLADPAASRADPRSELAEPLTIVRDAMLANPEMIAGRHDRLDTSLMKAAPGPDHQQGRHGGPARRSPSWPARAPARAPPAPSGLAVKIEDGDGYDRGTWAASVEALRQAGVLDGQALRVLARYHRPPMLDPHGRARRGVDPGVRARAGRRADRLRRAPTRRSTDGPAMAAEPDPIAPSGFARRLARRGQAGLPTPRQGQPPGRRRRGGPAAVPGHPGRLRPDRGAAGRAVRPRHGTPTRRRARPGRGRPMHDRADATHRAYGGRSRRTRSSRPSGRRGVGPAGRPAGRPPAGPDAPPAADAPPGPVARRGHRRRRPSARPRTTASRPSRSSPDWGGASWYGTTSGTYWTLNPKEYADPRKHGPEYQARRVARLPEPRTAEAVAGAGGSDRRSGHRRARRRGRAEPRRPRRRRTPPRRRRRTRPRPGGPTSGERSAPRPRSRSDRPRRRRRAPPPRAPRRRAPRRRRAPVASRGRVVRDRCRAGLRSGALAGGRLRHDRRPRRVVRSSAGRRSRSASAGCAGELSGCGRFVGDVRPGRRPGQSRRPGRGAGGAAARAAPGAAPPSWRPWPRSRRPSPGRSCWPRWAPRPTPPRAVARSACCSSWAGSSGSASGSSVRSDALDRGTRPVS